jgi:hypothetical protein
VAFGVLFWMEPLKKKVWPKWGVVIGKGQLDSNRLEPWPQPLTYDYGKGKDWVVADLTLRIC